jgi:hypothetical protein
MPEEIWVNLSEAAEIMRYNLLSVRKLADRLSKQPEAEREIRMRKRSFGWEMWLPDLMVYMSKPRRGPKPKRAKTLDEGRAD